VRSALCAPPSGSAELGQAAEAGFEINMAQCPNCGGELKIIAATLEQPVIENPWSRCKRFPTDNCKRRV